MSKDVVSKAQVFVQKRFVEIEETIHLDYHNWTHTEYVLETVRDLGKAHELEGQMIEDIELAALFHDLDYVNGAVQHEFRSAEMAEEFLISEEFSDQRIESVKRLILSTDIHVRAETLAEEIIKDADLAHLGSEDYLKNYQSLRKEMDHFSHSIMTDEEWKETCISFIKNHRYLTKEAKKRFAAIKQKNLALIESNL